jgi:hypothetical protein
VGDIVDGYIWSDEDVEEGNTEEGREERERNDGGMKRIKMDKGDRGRCVRALIELGNREKKDILGFLTVDEVLGCETPDECRKGRVEVLRRVDGSRDFLDPLGVMDNRWDWYAKCVCKVCTEEGKREHEEERERLWQALPRILGLKDWLSLEELKGEALYSGDS